VRTKSTTTDLVSDADDDAEELIVRRIRAERPADAIVAEEGSVGGSGSSGMRWLVDPLDGTINFLYGIPHWCVSVACADAEGVVVGVVYDPLRDELFRAERGGGAWLGNRRLASTSLSDLALALVATGFSYAAEERSAQAAFYAGVAGHIRDVRRAGSAALDLAYVAAARVDAYFELIRSPWDSAAGSLLVREAGGAVTEIAEPTLPGGPNLVASGAAIHAALCALVGVQSRENSID
jgi:fructose-1,6-bisphosphatase/inositol monophosphatase family enzyme